MPIFPRSPTFDAPADAAMRRDGMQGITLPVVQEELSVGKQRVDTGIVRVRTTTSEHEELVQMPLEREDVIVERVAIGRPVDAPLDVRQEGDVTIVPVHEETIVVHRQLVLKEELHIRRRIATVDASQPVRLRRQDVSIEHESLGGAAPPH
ncbi:YsnF/AvaK domain-containing protein [Cognatilysobacter segetis]|uniref:YsnF/AvaK domain-containing protein n=1 Tax=Cognatilysobacter segetis TaxID=2492394 RepID=UPI00105E2115|nr:YsnF/AvaK domain-containing protein [Lysobacter segetis]